MEQEKVISVMPGLTQWSVRERGVENPIAYFTTCKEALKYATAVAELKFRAVVRIMDKDGLTVSEERFGMKSGNASSESGKLSSQHNALFSTRK